MSDSKAKRLQNDGTFITIPSLMTQGTGAGLDTTNDSVSVYDASAGEQVNVPLAEFLDIRPTAGARFSVGSVTAVGASQASAALMSKYFNAVSGDSGSAVGVMLATASTGLAQTVKNINLTGDIQVYPQVSGQINTAAVNAAFVVPKNTSVTFVSPGATGLWYTTPHAAS